MAPVELKDRQPRCLVCTPSAGLDLSGIVYSFENDRQKIGDESVLVMSRWGRERGDLRRPADLSREC
jgi:hypothetical protein